MIWKIVLGVVVVLAVALLVRLLMLGKQSQEMKFSPPAAGQSLRPCPQSPNCVSSQSQDADHSIPPLQLRLPFARQRDKIVSILTSEMKGRLVSETSDHLHFEFQTSLFGFVDDFELMVDAGDPSLLNVRSASRVGYSDLRANRRRVEELRRRL